MLHEHKFSIIVLQETHASSEIEHLWSAEWGKKIIFANGTSTARGVAILLNKRLDIQIKDVCKDLEGRYLIVTFMYNDIEIICTGVYAPNSDDPQFFANVFSKAESYQGTKIYAGDLNTVLNYDLDIRGGKGYSHVRSSQFINDYMEQNDIVDI